jgi:hypothetical protein
MMLKTILLMTAIVASTLVPLGPAAAEDDAKLVENVSPQIADVVTGGSWSDGKQGGLYRAVVVMSGSEDNFGARLFVQWLALSDDSPIPSVVKTVPVKEINDQNLPNASIQVDGEENKDNEVYVVVSAYDFEADKDILLFVKAGKPGTYSVEKTPPKGLSGPPEGDGGEAGGAE